MDLESLQLRAGIIKKIREFFDSKNYLSLDTPLLQENLIPESCLEVFETTQLFPHGSKKKSKPLYLIPSPEISIKKIIAQHKVNVYQICKCFRNGESEGHLHNSEFTMLEYYTMNASYLDSLALTEELFAFLWSGNCCLSSKQDAPLPFERITVAQAFKKWAGIELFAAAKSQTKMEEAARKAGLDPPPKLGIPALYDLIFIAAIEPNLKTGKPTALLDYPAFVPCLAKESLCGKTVERWELYCNGIELANCFSEETDPEKVKRFFINEEAEKRKTALVQHKVDNNYWKVFKHFPQCSGVALGLDRLIMLLTGYKTINSVLP